MLYNTRSQPLQLKAYGRQVQTMVDQAVAIADRQQRNAMEHRIIEVMKIVSDQRKTSDDVMTKLWNHLAQLSSYRLDVDYPCAIQPIDQRPRPKRLSYPGHRIRLRHYGHMVEQLAQQIEQENDDGRRRPLIRTVATRMRRNLAELRGGAADVQRIAADLHFLTHGVVSTDEVKAALAP